ncbi:MAG TPA: Fe-S cluster assembly protein SufD [Pyrinomonadaceae bacterium]|nr:Fe-S cluster assembly protein SufD [Pyrinomonadaceae bacterium]
MTAEATTEKSLYAELFEETSARVQANEPEWLARVRADALERFERAGFPTTDEEDWKYTNVAPIARGSFRPVASDEAFAHDAALVESFVYEESRQSRLVFVDGVFRPKLSSTEGLPKEVVVTDLRSALAGPHAEVVREHLAQSQDHDRDAFTSLNTAFLGDGAFLLLPKGVSAGVPVQLLFLATGPLDETAIFPRVLVVAERDSSATILESYAALNESAYFTNSVVETFVGEGARVVHYKVQRESERAFHVASTRASLGRAATYDLTTVTLGARLSRHGVEVRLSSEGAECWVDGLYLVGEGQHADTHSLIDHQSPRCTSHQNYKGILDGRSRAVFNGRVFVHRDAQQTDAFQSNKNLLLSSEARVDTKPQLEIYADDVKCAHGATVGQLEEEELFYLTSRGLHPDLARNLLTYGFAEEIVEKVKIESIKRQLDEAILNRLQAELEA